MNNFEDEQNQTEKNLNKFLQNFENLFSEFETLNNAIKSKKTKKKKNEQTKEQIIKENNNNYNQQIQNNQLNNFFNNQTYHKDNLILLSNKQEFNEDKSYQKLVNLLIEENDSIPDVRFIKNNSDDYLLLQLFTSFSLMSRKIYLNNNNKNNKINKYKSFINEINNYKFNKNSPLNNDDLNFFNANLISIEDIYPENKEKIQFEINLNKELNKEINNLNNDNNNINNNNENININLNSIKNYKLCKGEKFCVNSKLKNIKEKNLKILKSKKYNLNKIFDMDDLIFEGMNKNEIEDLLYKIYNEKNIYNEYDFSENSEKYYENLTKNEFNYKNDDDFDNNNK